MAKKKQDLSLEKLLEHALVPESEQPYEVPGNWVWVRLDSISEIVTGGTPSKKNEQYYGGIFPFIKPADLDQGRHVLYATEYLSDEGKKVSRVIPDGSTSVCCIGTIGKCGFLEIEATTNQQINSVIPKIEKLFVYYFSCTDYFINQLMELASATTISIVNKGKMSKTSFPLPPLAEQQRIVDRIESLFEKLEQAKDLIQDALDSFENRKAAILHKAFTGELTKKWREENRVGMDSWEEKHLEQLCSEVIDCSHSTPKWTESGKICLRTTNLNDGYIDFSEVRYVSDEMYKERTKRLVPMSGDILFTREGSVGDLGVIPPGIEICMGQRMMLLRPQNDVQPNYIVYYLQSPIVREVIKQKTGGSTSPHMNVKDIKRILVLVATRDERREIVRILDSLFEKEQSAKTLCDLIDNIDLMKKSILARSFRGELGTNDPEEESALELLKEIIAEQK